MEAGRALRERDAKSLLNMYEKISPTSTKPKKKANIKIFQTNSVLAAISHNNFADIRT